MFNTTTYQTIKQLQNPHAKNLFSGFDRLFNTTTVSPFFEVTLIRNFSGHFVLRCLFESCIKCLEARAIVKQMGLTRANSKREIKDFETGMLVQSTI